MTVTVLPARREREDASIPEAEEFLAALGTPVTRKELRRLAAQMGRNEARFLVDTYYEIQRHRTAMSNQQKALEKAAEPHVVLDWHLTALVQMEQTIKVCMAAFAENDALASWAMSIIGIGPVLASGLVAHIDIERAPTVGHIWRFAGLDPTLRWEKGKPRPYNAALKLLCWKIAESFVKTKGHAESVYGPLYDQRKVREQERNQRGENAVAAQARLARGGRQLSPEQRELLAAGQLTPKAIDMRSRRWVVKLFLAHYHEAAYRLRYGTDPPAPYPLAHLGHAHRIAAPTLPPI